MIAFDDAMSWLNQFDRTHISGPVVRSLVDQISNPRLPVERLKELGDQALQGSRIHPDPLMTPEVHLILAQAYFQRGDLRAAEGYAAQAVSAYQVQMDRHREATALYLLGIIQSSSTYQNATATGSWLGSREKFSALSNERLFGAAGNERAWYLDVLSRINIDLAAQFGTAIEWLPLFDEKGSRLQASGRALRERMLAAVRAMNYPAARSIIELLIDTSTDSDDRLELPEALVASAQAEFDMGNLEKAKELLRRAIAIYPPRSHWQAVTRWMLGIVQWQTPSGSADALQNWQQSIAVFLDLATRADQRNQQDQKDWYVLRSAEMQAALDERLSAVR